MTPTFHALSLAVVLAAPLGANAQAPAAPPASRSAVERLRAFLEREWDEQMRRDPVEASLLGDRRWNDRWADLSLEALAQQHAHDAAALAELETIDRAALPPAEQLSFDLFAYQLRMAVEGYPHEWYLVPLGSFSGVQMAGTLAERFRFDSLKDYDDWLGRLRSYPRYVDQTIALLRRGIERKRLQPKSVVKRVQDQLAKLLAQDPAGSPFYQPFTRFPPGVSPADRQRLAAAGLTAMREQVFPALQRLEAFLAGPYWTAAPERPGVWQFPGGRELYAFLVRENTTTRLTPQEIHEIGLREVARIRGEMDALRRELRFAGDLPRFLEYLRTDDAFRFKDPEDVLEKTRACAKRIDPTLVKLFRTLPRMPYGISPIPEAQAAAAPPYYSPPAADGSRAGFYYVNTLRADRTWASMATALHETVPGHHFQISLAMELDELPRFRRYGGYTAYVEGWGLYAERLGEELGLYDDAYQRFGRLSNEMWRAVRLVVDTGLHSLGWDRQKAIDYFKSQAPSDDETITAEIDRYIAWPGQALAYKLGELKIQELRRRAQDQLGDRFDVKEFHDVVLLSGALPLEVLDARVGAWIAEKRRAR